MTRAALALAGLLAASAAAAEAPALFAEPFFADRLAPGDLAYFGASCQVGDLVSGGYRLNQFPPFPGYEIVANYPETAVRWTIGIRNISDRPIEIGGQVYAVCQEQ